ncbi:Chemotaxis protein CheA [Aquisphaera giovannonii]|uniref:Chemotaxis protein CheA n=1 Tax=Aquisphaera giovannonii TaxID=406548 RepID=A0A5B9VVN8_9BACT|nr:chemotaxis protein CheW [Aquisphaera giovannonii]QEH31780.1 Chemotaxis protein CheA [Aquisphaera giovannonii]
MSGFNPAELLPFYLDETDEHIAALNDALLRLEQDPADAKALAEAFRMFHSIKGSSVVMGFDSVKELTHHLESLFDQFRSKKRDLDRPVLDLTFRCLDELRDYHRELRAEGAGRADLASLVPLVVAALDESQAPAPASARPPEPAAEAPAGPAADEPGTPAPAPGPARAASPSDEPERVAVTVVFEPNLPLADMKARLVLSRLATRGTVIETRPPAEQIEEAESLAEFTVWLATSGGPDELRSLADVDGVARIRIEAGASLPSTASPAAEAVAPSPQPSPAVGGGSEVAPTEQARSASAVPPPVVPAAVVPASEPPAAAAPKKKVAETIRVESDRLDYLMNLAGELVINKARFVDIARGLDELFRGSNTQALAADTEDRLESITRGLDGLGAAGAGDGALDRWAGHVRRLRDNVREIHGELDRLRQGRETLKALNEAIHSLGRVTDGLQKGVLDTRMVPIGPLFERFRRVIRDLSHSSGKEVLLALGGEKTELDKRMIDELGDPLIHMVRNSVDHGLEPPDAREAAGKPRAGTVTLQATHRGNSVVITVGDDGRGIDCERIRAKVVARGLVSQAEAAGLTDRELIAYIWHPGLSTAEAVTDISGRGVGMDIVKNRIENLSGTVDVRSTPGQGTVFTIRLPLTLAIMSSLLVQVFDEVYALPLDHIDEIVEVKASQVFRVQGRPTIEVRKRIIALVSLKELFRWSGRPHPPAMREAGPEDGDGNGTHPEAVRVVVVQNGETTIGLVVDRLIGMQEVVLKSLEKNFRAVPGLSGASILGDGRVSLILDVDAVITMAAGRMVGREMARAGM